VLTDRPLGRRMEVELVGVPAAGGRFPLRRPKRWPPRSGCDRDPADACGQVGDFAYYGPTNVFDRAALDSRLLFSADRPAVSMEPQPEG
jgi:hypothetical protein